VDLVGREAGAGGVVHGVDHAVDERLEGRRAQLLAGDGAGLLAQDGVTDLGDLEDGHGALFKNRKRPDLAGPAVTLGPLSGPVNRASRSRQPRTTRALSATLPSLM
jgi:hypothetical protein